MLMRFFHTLFGMSSIEDRLGLSEDDRHALRELGWSVHRKKAKRPRRIHDPVVAEDLIESGGLPLIEVERFR